MKKPADYLQKLYAILLLAVISVSVLPVKLLHQHEGERFSISSGYDNQTGNFTAGDQVSCPVCLYTFIHHYLPGSILQTAEIQLTESYSVPEITFHLPVEQVFCFLRGPPAC